jgi:hypothetical protein
MKAVQTSGGLGHLLPRTISHLIVGRLTTPLTREAARNAEQRLALLNTTNPGLEAFGRPMCFWAGMPGELTVLAGQFEAPSHRGLPITGDSVSLVLPRSPYLSHTLVLEVSLPTEAMVSCHFNGRWSPVLRVDDRPNSLLVIDVSTQGVSRSVATQLSKSSINLSGLDGHVLHLHIRSKVAASGPKLVLSRLWTF